MSTPYERIDLKIMHNKKKSSTSDRRVETTIDVHNSIQGTSRLTILDRIYLSKKSLTIPGRVYLQYLVMLAIFRITVLS